MNAQVRKAASAVRRAKLDSNLLRAIAVRKSTLERAR
jgi:hypothetical protein